MPWERAIYAKYRCCLPWTTTVTLLLVEEPFWGTSWFSQQTEDYFVQLKLWCDQEICYYYYLSTFNFKVTPSTLWIRLNPKETSQNLSKTGTGTISWQLPTYDQSKTRRQTKLYLKTETKFLCNLPKPVETRHLPPHFMLGETFHQSPTN